MSLNGLVGLFDILGYQTFLENNCPETAAEQVEAVLNTLTTLDEGRRQALAAVLGHDRDSDEMVKRTKSLVFSDSVLLTLDLSGLKESNQEPLSLLEIKDMAFDIFLLQCIWLWRRMFEFGLPLRGAITKGPYLIKEALFVGRPMVEAHKLGKNINCSGVVLADAVVQWCKDELPAGSVAPKALYFDYSFPIKDPEEPVGSVALNVTWSGDIHPSVHASFSAHHKVIGPGVPQKIENTEGLLLFLKTKWPKAQG